MLVIKLAEQALRPKRIASLALPLAALGSTVTAGVQWRSRALGYSEY